MNTFDNVIFVSSEDDTYRVCGGIGTYIGLLSRTIKQISPACNVFWITRSHSEEDFEFVDNYGVYRYYLAATLGTCNPAFTRYLSLSDEFVSRMLFTQRVTAKVSLLLSIVEGNSLIEIGEWEGQGCQLFPALHSARVLKVARLHTPLAVCMMQNHLSSSATNTYQLISEYETVMNADVVSSSTHYMKEMVEKHFVEGCKSLHHPIIVLPNPVDDALFKSGLVTREQAIALLNSFLPAPFLRNDTFNVLIPGSVELRKGVDLIVQAIPAIVEKCPRVRFCFIGHHGDGGGKNLTANTKLSPADLLRLVPEKVHENISFTGYIPHRLLPAVYQAGDVFPIMSRGDNFPGTVAEIALTSKAIVALQRGGVQEMLTDKFGCFSAVSVGCEIDGAAERLAHILCELYNHPEVCFGLGLKARDVIHEKYHAKRVTEDILAHYWEAFVNKKALVPKYAKGANLLCRSKPDDGNLFNEQHIH